MLTDGYILYIINSVKRGNSTEPTRGWRIQGKQTHDKKSFKYLLDFVKWV